MLLLGIPFILLLSYLYSFIYSYGNKILCIYFKEIVLYYKLDTEENIVNKYSDYKCKYIIKNLFKSLMLALLLIPASVCMYDSFFNNNWSNLLIRFMGCIYVSLDFSGLVYVNGLPLTTIIHHLVVCVFGLLCLLVDFQMEGYYRSILIYTYYSILPFLVNFYLGFRYLSYNTDLNKLVSKICFYNYSISLILNLLSIGIFFWNSVFSYSIIVYLLFFGLILNDDIKLIKFLYNENKKTVE